MDSNRSNDIRNGFIRRLSAITGSLKKRKGSVRQGRTDRQKGGEKMKWVFTAVFAVVAFMVLLTFGWVDVQPTEVAVEINKVAGKVSEQPRGVGYHFFNRWVTDMVIYKVGARSFPPDTTANERSTKYNLDLKTNDGQNIEVDMTIIYCLDSNSVPLLHQKVGVNYEDQVILPQVKSEARIVVGCYSAEEIYQGKIRDQIQKLVKEKLSESLAMYPAIKIQDALLRHFAFSGEFEKSIEQKKLAAQQVEVNKNRAMAQEQESLRQEAEARGFKLKRIQEAEAQSKTMSIEAEGKAMAIKATADADRYRLEQEAAGNLARFKAEAEGKRLSAEALGGGQNVVALEFAKNIPDKLQIWGIPTGAQSTSIMDLNGVFGKMLNKESK